MTTLLEEYDPCPQSIIEPEMVAPFIPNFPITAVTCFSQRLLNKVLTHREKNLLCTLDTEDGGIPVYRISHNGCDLAIYLSRVGAPACVVQMEEMISRGSKKFVMFGSCGVLDNTLDKWCSIVPTAAFRDEGVSYHYLPAAPEISIAPDSVRTVQEAFDALGTPYVLGKVWTTDAIYRETKAKTEKRKEQGCIAVDMECASVHAVAKFREVKVAQFFYAEDNLDSPVWDARGLSHTVHTQADRLFLAALSCAVRL